MKNLLQESVTSTSEIWFSDFELTVILCDSLFFGAAIMILLSKS